MHSTDFHLQTRRKITSKLALSTIAQLEVHDDFILLSLFFCISIVLLFPSYHLDLIYIQWKECNVTETVTQTEFRQMLAEKTLYLGQTTSNDSVDFF